MLTTNFPKLFLSLYSERRGQTTNRWPNRELTNQTQEWDEVTLLYSGIFTADGRQRDIYFRALQWNCWATVLYNDYDYITWTRTRMLAKWCGVDSNSLTSVKSVNNLAFIFFTQFLGRYSQPHMENVCLGRCFETYERTSLSNCESGASPQSIPPPEDRELSEGDVMAWRLEL